MVTYNNILNTFKYFADNHKQINWFYSGEAADFQAGTNYYPAMIVFPSGAKSSTDSNFLTYSIYFLDIINRDGSNKDEIYSDQLSITEDFTKYLEHNHQNGNINFRITDDNVIKEPREEILDDILCGWMITFTVEFVKRPFCDIEMIPVAPTDCNNPEESDVREGVVYGIDDALIGTYEEEKYEFLSDYVELSRDTYQGVAPEGSATSDGVWNITKEYTNRAGYVISTEQFNNVAWDDRYSL